MLIKGTAGNDKYPNHLEGGGSADQIYGYAGMDDLYGMDGDDLLVGGKGADELFGGDGFDTASYAGSTAGVTVNLDFGYGSGGDAEGDGLYSIDGVIGSAKADHIEGSVYDNRLKGEKGNDELRGKAGADDLFGGKGADRFEYGQAADSGPGAAARDVIDDFSRSQGDRIDLQDVDANGGAGGNQVFAFVGGNAFTAAGQVRFAQAGGDTVIQASTDADAAAEMEIVLDGNVALQASDFVL